MPRNGERVLGSRRWAMMNMNSVEWVTATVYTSGELYPMCAAAHSLVVISLIVYVSFSELLVAWLAGLERAAPPVRSLRIQEVIRDVALEESAPNLAEPLLQKKTSVIVVLVLHEKLMVWLPTSGRSIFVEFRSDNFDWNIADNTPGSIQTFCLSVQKDMIGKKINELINQYEMKSCHIISNKY